ncbi:MAG: hypothetical protein HIU88_09010 [Acidobacteria bacterium]|nr:hypothetical protein [Acidobacteriota bacterium]
MSAEIAAIEGSRFPELTSLAAQSNDFDAADLTAVLIVNRKLLHARRHDRLPLFERVFECRRECRDTPSRDRGGRA